MATITKKQFLSDVAKEVEALKVHATDEEKSRLDLRTFGPANADTCIYGQMALDCRSKRAKELMDVSCVRQMDAASGASNLRGMLFSAIKEFVNGSYNKNTWRGESSFFRGKNDDYERDWSYLSSLEGYILLKDAKPENVIAYIKGETDKLVL